MRCSRRRGTAAAAAVLAVGLLAAGCGGGGGPAGPPAAPSPAVVVSAGSTPSPGEPASPVPVPPVPIPPPSPSPWPPGPPRYVFPVRGCDVGYGREHHDYPATDIFTSVGCAFVAPTDGVVDEVIRTDRWDPATNQGADRGGRAVSVVGDDGVRYYGSHLRDIAPGVRQGERVAAGALLGHVGTSGDAATTPSHVHFGLSWPTRPGAWWVRRGVLAPGPTWTRGARAGRCRRRRRYGPPGRPAPTSPCAGWNADRSRCA